MKRFLKSGQYDKGNGKNGNGKNGGALLTG
jgi:hypothetical protein